MQITTHLIYYSSLVTCWELGKERVKRCVYNFQVFIICGQTWKGIDDDKLIYEVRFRSRNRRVLGYNSSIGYKDKDIILSLSLPPVLFE